MAILTDPPITVIPYIKQVQVHDYAPLRNARIDFKRGLNIIIGQNGTGKTRFLTLLSELADLRESKKHFWGAGCQITFGGPFSEKDQIVVDFEELADSSLSSEPLAWDTTLQLSNSIHLTGRYFDHLGESRAVEDFLALYPPILIAHGTPVSGLPILDESAELVLEKRSATIQLKDGIKRVGELNSRFANAIVRSLFSMIRRGFTVISGFTVPPMTVEAVRHQTIRLVEAYSARLNHSLPLYSPVQAVRCSEYFQVYYQEVQDQYTIKGLVLEYQVNDEWLSFRMLSDGTKRLVYTLAEILAPESVGLIKATDEIKVYDRERIILLEEPELGLHLSQLQKFLSLIREVARENQVILTTHSPQVLDMLGKDELDRVTICELDPKRGTKFRKLSAAKKAKAKVYMQNDSYLSDFWRFSNLEDPG